MIEILVFATFIAFVCGFAGTVLWIFTRREKDGVPIAFPLGLWCVFLLLLSVAQAAHDKSRYQDIKEEKIVLELRDEILYAGDQRAGKLIDTYVKPGDTLYKYTRDPYTWLGVQVPEHVWYTTEEKDFQIDTMFR